jgi:putative aldouronate transport system permease protein
VLDGATDFAVLFRVFVPLSAPVLATITLFSAVSHWNSWFDGIMFLARREMWPVQSYLYSVVTTAELERRFSTTTGASEAALHYLHATPRGLSAAFIIFASIPILMVYPFLQRYFITGLTLGSLKE